MGSLGALPQLQVNQPQPINFLDQVGKLAELRSSALRNQVLMQQAAVQQQMAPAQIASAQAAATLNQIKVHDAQASAQAFRDAGGDLPKYYNLMQEYGVSVGEIIQQQSQIQTLLTEKQTYAQNKLTGQKDLTQRLFDQAQSAKAIAPNDPDKAQEMLDQIVADASSGPFKLLEPNTIPRLQATPDNITHVENVLGMNNQLIDQAIKDQEAIQARQKTAKGADELAEANADYAGYKQYYSQQVAAGKPAVGYTTYQAAASAQAAAEAELPAAEQRAAYESGLQRSNTIYAQTHQAVLGSAWIPYTETLGKVNEARTALDLAKGGNIIAARSIIGSLVGITGVDFNTPWTEKIFGKMFGGFNEKAREQLHGIFTGNALTPKLAGDADDFLTSMLEDARTTANLKAQQIGAGNGVPVGTIPPEPQPQRPLSPTGQLIQSAIRPKAQQAGAATPAPAATKPTYTPEVKKHRKRYGLEE